jgi:hypothetical protein
MTTAQKLIAYRKELIQGGLDPDVVRDIVKDAAQTLVINEGLKVAPLERTPPPGVPSKPLPPQA